MTCGRAGYWPCFCVQGILMANQLQLQVTKKILATLHSLEEKKEGLNCCFQS